MTELDIARAAVDSNGNPRLPFLYGSSSEFLLITQFFYPPAFCFGKNAAVILGKKCVKQGKKCSKEDVNS